MDYSKTDFWTLPVLLEQEEMLKRNVRNAERDLEEVRDAIAKAKERERKKIEQTEAA